MEMKNKQPTVSVVLLWNKDVPYKAGEFTKTIESILENYYPAKEVIVVDNTGKRPKKPWIGRKKSLARKVKFVAGKFKNRAASFNAGIKKAKGDYIALVDSLENAIQFRKSALDCFVMAAERNPDASMIYSDYERIASDGSLDEVHLLPYHEGRLRDAVDFGKVLFFPAKMLRKLRYVKDKYDAADWYDLRLRASEKGRLVGVSNRFNGSLYSVYEQAGEFDVFYYLKAGKDTQLELEKACTEHLKRVKAYLAPGQNYKAVKYSPKEEKQFKCLFSVVIPVFNRPEFIANAIDSVQAQTLGKKVEVIVVCNGGPDDPTVDAVKEYMKGGEKYDKKKSSVDLIVTDINNLGLCFNLGLKKARGKYYLQLDSDDQLTPDAAEKVLEVYESDPTVGMVIGSYEVWVKDKKGKIKRDESMPVVTHGEWTDKNGRNNLLRINGAGAPRSAHIKVIRNVGWFGCNDEPYCRNYGEDYDLVCRITEQYRMGRVWEPIYKVVRHEGGTDHSPDQYTIDLNDNAKDHMRYMALQRRKAINAKAKPKKKSKSRSKKKKK